MLRSLHRAGISVPRVLAIHDGYIVLSDSGTNLAQYIRQSSDTAEQATLVAKAAALLAQIHLSGHWHGNAKLRNFTYDGATVSAIDFENARTLWPHGYRRVKDLMMLCGSTTPHAPSGWLIDTVLSTYTAHLSVRAFYFFALMMLPIFLLFYPIRSVAGRDIREMALALKAVYRFIWKRGT